MHIPNKAMDILEVFAANYPHNLDNSRDAQGRGWQVADNCTISDFELFEECLQYGGRSNLPRKMKLCFYDGKIFIKRIPSGSYEECAAGLAAQFTFCLNSRISNRAIFRSRGSADHKIGDNQYSQPDVSVLRNPNIFPNVIAEISSTGTTTADLVRQCRDHLHCPHIKYVLGIAILPFIGTNQTDKQVRIIAHLFQRGVNNDVAPITVVSFGNVPLTLADGTTIRNDLIQSCYSGYEDKISFRGVGFDAQAPECSHPSIPYYRLYFNPQLMLQDDDGSVNYIHVDEAHRGHLQDACWIDLFMAQARVRMGFFGDGTFQLPIDTDVLEALQAVT